MSASDHDHRERSIELAIAAWRPEMGMSLTELASVIKGFLTGGHSALHPAHAGSEHKLDAIARALHDLAHVIREDGEHTRKELRIMSANSDAAAAAALTLAASVDAALAAGIGTGGAIPPDVAADAAALPVATQAMTDQAARLTAATPAPVV